jgi:hypothetical protein
MEWLTREVSLAFTFGIIVGVALAALITEMISKYNAKNKNQERAEQKIESTQRNIGNRICNALNDAAEQNQEIRLRARTMFCNSGEVYRVYMSFALSNADLFLVDIDPRQPVPITVFFNKSKAQKFYGITEDQLKVLIQELQFFVANYSLRRQVWRTK